MHIQESGSGGGLEAGELSTCSALPVCCNCYPWQLFHLTRLQEDCSIVRWSGRAFRSLTERHHKKTRPSCGAMATWWGERWQGKGLRI